MSFVALFCVVLVLHGADFTSAGTLDLSDSKIAIQGKAKMTFDSPGRMWAGLANARRFPILKSGDLIALRLATTSGTPKWLSCHKSSSKCSTSTCPGAEYMVAAKWAACPAVVFRIRARGKADGQSVDSGDSVRITFPYYGENRHLYCQSSSSGYCYGHHSVSSWTGNNWLSHQHLVYQIFSKSGPDGEPVQLGDIVGLKFPYQSNSGWIANAGSYFGARSCSSSTKTSCAKENVSTGFQIFKKL